MLPYSAILLSALTLASAAALPGQDVTKPRSPTDRLPKPAGVSAAQQPDKRIRVVWSAVDGAVRYKLIRSVPPEGSRAVPLPNPSDTQYVDADVKPGGTYYYLVSAVNEAGIEGLRVGSPPVTAAAVVAPVDPTPAPVPPATNVVATVYDYLHPQVSWKTSVPGARFIVERREDDGSNPALVTWKEAVTLIDKPWLCSTTAATCQIVEDTRPIRRNTTSQYRVTTVEAPPSTRRSEPVTSNEILMELIPTAPTEIHDLVLVRGQTYQIPFRPAETGLQYVSLDTNTVRIFGPGVITAKEWGSTFVAAVGLMADRTFKSWIWRIRVGDKAP